MDNREANLRPGHNNDSLTSSPPDFLRNVQAAFKRHRMMPQLNNLQPRRLVVRRQEPSITDSKPDESHDVSVKPLTKNMATLTTVNHESASVTPSSISSTPTEEQKFKSLQPVGGPKKVQFALENDARSHMNSLALTEMECEVHKVISQYCTICALKKIKLKGRDYATAYGFCQDIEYLNKLKGKYHIIQLIDYEAEDSVLNLPVERMDYYVPG